MQECKLCVHFDSLCSERGNCFTASLIAFAVVLGCFGSCAWCCVWLALPVSLRRNRPAHCAADHQSCWPFRAGLLLAQAYASIALGCLLLPPLERPCQLCSVVLPYSRIFGGCAGGCFPSLTCIARLSPVCLYSIAPGWYDSLQIAFCDLTPLRRRH